MSLRCMPCHWLFISFHRFTLMMPRLMLFISFHSFSSFRYQIVSLCLRRYMPLICRHARLRHALAVCYWRLCCFLTLPCRIVSLSPLPFTRFDIVLRWCHAAAPLPRHYEPLRYGHCCLCRRFSLMPYTFILFLSICHAACYAIFRHMMPPPRLFIFFRHRFDVMPFLRIA